MSSTFNVCNRALPFWDDMNTDFRGAKEKSVIKILKL